MECVPLLWFLIAAGLIAIGVGCGVLLLYWVVDW